MCEAAVAQVLVEARARVQDLEMQLEEIKRRRQGEEGVQRGIEHWEPNSSCSVAEPGGGSAGGV